MVYLTLDYYTVMKTIVVHSEVRESHEQNISERSHTAYMILFNDIQEQVKLNDRV